MEPRIQRVRVETVVLDEPLAPHVQESPEHPAGSFGKLFERGPDRASLLAHDQLVEHPSL